MAKRRDDMAVTAQLMGKGTFKLMRTLTGYDDVRIEYWLGVSGNGACLRPVYPDGLVTISHVHDSRQIEDWLARYEYHAERSA
jgi:hypothetical protein